jgi:hypothetical protein
LSDDLRGPWRTSAWLGFLRSIQEAKAPQTLVGSVQFVASGELSAEGSEPVLAHDRRDIILGEAAIGESRRELRQVGNRVDLGGRRLGALTAVEVTADAEVLRIARIWQTASIASTSESRRTACLPSARLHAGSSAQLSGSTPMMPSRATMPSMTASDSKRGVSLVRREWACVATIGPS